MEPVTGEYRCEATGEPLTKHEAASYERYQERLKDRCRMGEVADKLVRIRDKYLSIMLEECRIYMGYFPYSIKKLLKQAHKIQEKMKKICRQKHKRKTKITAEAAEEPGENRATAQSRPTLQASRESTGNRMINERRAIDDSPPRLAAENSDDHDDDNSPEGETLLLAMGGPQADRRTEGKAAPVLALGQIDSRRDQHRSIPTQPKGGMHGTKPAMARRPTSTGACGTYPT